MAKQIEDEVQYYYDSHPTEEDLMGETSFHAGLVRYLMLVLERLFHGYVCAIYENLNFYQTRDPREYPIAPDIAVIKGVPFCHLRSWKVGKTGPAPHVVFEVASEETWRKDLKEKPAKYASMGVEEYFLYDPNRPSVWRDASHRLVGWRLDAAKQEMVQVVPDGQGRLWSQHLESWLVPDGVLLRLYDRDQQLRLTSEETETKRAEAEAAARRAEARRAKAEARRAKAEARRAEIEARRAEMLAEKLRSLGVNPDEI